VADGERMNPSEGGASAPIQEDDEDLDGKKVDTALQPGAQPRARTLADSSKPP
jgi:hypothetical protein